MMLSSMSTAFVTGLASGAATASAPRQNPAYVPQAATPPRPWADEARDWFPPGEPGKDYTPVFTPNGATLEYKIIDGVKVFHLIAEEIVHEVAPGLVVNCWGYNGRMPGPTIEVRPHCTFPGQGLRVRL